MREPNPYAAPATDTSWRPGLEHGGLKYYYLATFLTQAVLGLFVPAAPDLAIAVGGFSLLALGWGLVCWGMWTHRTWSLVAERLRRGVTPARAVVYSLIPGLSFWWSFVYNFRVTEGLQRTLRKHDTLLEAPTTLAWVSPVASILCTLAAGSVIALQLRSPTVVSPRVASLALQAVTLAAVVAGFVWMVRVDGCHAELLLMRDRKRSARRRRSAEPLED